jgi:uncharacterized membrane protein YgdD (TMEM256/DUF423 family)
MTPSRFAVGIYAFGAVSALASVALAAFPSPGLQGLAPTGALAVEWFKIGTDFQMNHALGMILVAAIADHLHEGRGRTLMRTAAVLLGAGALLFPGSLYLLSFDGPAFLAPWGGVAAMAGWGLFAAAGFFALLKPAPDEVEENLETVD